MTEGGSRMLESSALSLYALSSWPTPSFALHAMYFSTGLKN